MQLLPVSNTSGNGTTETRTENSGRGGLDFMKLLSDALSSTPAEVTPVLDIATSTSNTGTPLDAYSDSDATKNEDDWQTVDAPYSEPVEPSVPLGAATPIQDIRLTDNELHGVIESLREQGADEDTLTRVAALLGNPGGTPLKDVVKAVADTAAAKLTDGDLQRIGSLADRLDATGQLKVSLLNDLKNGRTQQAMASFTEALNKSLGENSSQKFNADKNELLALAKALKIDPKVMESLEKSFGKKNSKTISLAELKAMMGPVELDMAEQGKRQAKIAGLLEAALTPAVSKARSRLEKEAEAAGKVSRRTEQSETLIRDTVTRPGLAQASGAAQADGNIGKNEKAGASPTQTAELANAQKQAANAGKDAGAKNSQGQSPDAEAANKALDAKAKKSENAKAMGLEGKSKNEAAPREDPWDALLRKLEVKTEAQPVQTTKSDVQPVTGQFNAAQTMQNMNSPRQANIGNTQAARVLSQVEQGVYSALSDGTKRLTLYLNPVEMGAVSVVLSSRNGEVSATLKPERAETAAMLNQQVEILRANLEQQGIKVDKVDVQTPQMQNQNNWQGMDQHNASQEKQARQDALERLRRTSRVHDADTDTFSNSAQAMRHAARGASSGSLNVVA